MDKNGAPTKNQDLKLCGTSGSGVLCAHKDAAAAFRELRAAALKAGFSASKFTIFSAYRNQQNQDAKHAQAQQTHGKDAGKWVAKRSEHITGRALDIELGYGDNSGAAKAGLFEALPEYTWIKANAGRFGFNPYAREPWHWTYNVK